MLDTEHLEKKSKTINNSKHGGPRPGAGRRKGVGNKVTQQIREIAAKHGPEAIQNLVNIMKKGESEAARVAASKEILDRAYGKSTQPLEGGDTPIDVVNTIRFEIVDTDG